jgi:ketosteroid isomerase-like protein
VTQENVEIFKRGIEAYNRRDVEALLADAHPEIEWQPALLVKLGGKATTYRGHAGIRELMSEIEDTLAEIHVEFPEPLDLGDRLLAVGKIRTRGKTSGVVTESPVGYLADFRDGKVVRIRTYLDPKEALAAAGQSVE